MQIDYETERELGIDYETLAVKVADKVLEMEKCPYDAQVNLVLTDNEEIERVNTEFRNIARPTDVLSFPMIPFETPADRLFATIMKLAEEGKINEAENELYMGMVEDDVDYLELALTFYLYLNDMDGDFLDDNGYSREEVLEGMKDLASDWGVTGLEAF